MPNHFVMVVDENGVKRYMSQDEAKVVNMRKRQRISNENLTKFEKIRNENGDEKIRKKVDGLLANADCHSFFWHSDRSVIRRRSFPYDKKDFETIVVIYREKSPKKEKKRLKKVLSFGKADRDKPKKTEEKEKKGKKEKHGERASANKADKSVDKKKVQKDKKSEKNSAEEIEAINTIEEKAELRQSSEEDKADSGKSEKKSKSKKVKKNKKKTVEEEKRETENPEEKSKLKKDRKSKKENKNKNKADVENLSIIIDYDEKKNQEAADIKNEQETGKKDNKKKSKKWMDSFHKKKGKKAENLLKESNNESFETKQVAETEKAQETSGSEEKKVEENKKKSADEALVSFFFGKPKPKKENVKEDEDKDKEEEIAAEKLQHVPKKETFTKRLRDFFLGKQNSENPEPKQSFLEKLFGEKKLRKDGAQHKSDDDLYKKSTFVEQNPRNTPFWSSLNEITKKKKPDERNSYSIFGKKKSIESNVTEDAELPESGLSMIKEVTGEVTLVSYKEKDSTSSDTESVDHASTGKTSITALTSKKLPNFKFLSTFKSKTSKENKAMDLEEAAEDTTVRKTTSEGVVYAELDITRNADNNLVRREADDKTEYAEIVIPNKNSAIKKSRDDLRKSQENLAGSRENLAEPEVLVSAEGKKEAAV